MKKCNALLLISNVYRINSTFNYFSDHFLKSYIRSPVPKPLRLMSEHNIFFILCKKVGIFPTEVMEKKAKVLIKNSPDCVIFPVQVPLFVEL